MNMLILLINISILIKNIFSFKITFIMPNFTRRRMGTRAPKKRASRKVSPKVLKTTINKLSKRVNGDLNWRDLDVNPAQITYSGSVIGLSDFVQGDGVGERDGLMQANHSLELRLGAYGIYQSPGIYLPATCRAIVIVDKENSITAASDVLYVTGSANSVLSVYNKLKRHKFEVLADVLFKTEVSDPEQFRRISLNLRDKVQKYSGTTAASVTENCIKLILISNSAAGSSAPNMAYTGRLTYYG